MATIGNLQIVHDFYVVSDLCCQMLWGTDILVKLGLSIDFSQSDLGHQNRLLAG